MRVLNQAANAYNNTKTQMAASGGVSIGVLIKGRSRLSKKEEIEGPTNWPPSKTPKMMDAIVRPSIQPLALTSKEAGKSSVRMPYLAGE